MTTTRRAWIGSAAAVAVVAAWPARARGADLRRALDAAAAEPDPARALHLLAGIDADRSAGPERLDLITARAGLSIDRAITHRFGIDPRSRGPGPADPGYYALLLHRKLGDTDSLRAIERRLETELTRSIARAGHLFDRCGVTAGASGVRFSTLWQDGRYRYADSDADRDQAVGDMNRWLAGYRAQATASFGTPPPYCLNVAARRSSATAKPGTRALPTPIAAGTYTVDLTTIRRRPSWTLPSVVAHELLPGHMLQMPMEAAVDPHPLRLDYASGFPEGWGIYAEQAVAAAGAYVADPHAELGYLHWRLFRIGRALADLGIHIHHRSLDEARARLVAWQGEPAYFAPFDTDLARIAQEPAVRLAEMLAALAIEDAARRAGPNLRRFHQAMLIDGRMRTEEIRRRPRV